MTHIERLYLLDRLHHLIAKKGTGPPKELSNRLDVSERTVYNLISTLRCLGADIVYCNNRSSYCYKTEVAFNFLPVLESKNIKGGKNVIMPIQSVYTLF